MVEQKHSSDFKYGCCPICGDEGVSRERRPNGNDQCCNGHTYPSKDAIPRTAVAVPDDGADAVLEKLVIMKAAMDLTPERQHEVAEAIALNLGMVLVGHDPYAEGEIDKTSKIYLQGFHDGVKSKDKFEWDGGPK